MRVSKLALRGFMSHDQMDVELPDRGVVLVTGPNGAGKSSIVEGVAAAVWGKTTRGASPWRDGEKGSAAVEVDEERVERTRSPAGRTKVAWPTSGAKYDTARAAQTAIDARWGDLATWQRTSVFSASDASTFTGATDAERKRMLERLLGLGRFDAAHKAVRADLRTAQADARDAERAHEATLARLQSAKDAVTARAEALAALAPPGDAGLTDADADDADAALAALDAEVRSAKTELRDAERAQAEVERKLAAAADKARDAQRALKRLESMGECPTCQQPISEHRLDAARAAAAYAIDAADACEAAEGDALAAARADVEDCEDTLAALQRKANAARAAAADIAARLQAAKRAAGAADQQRAGLAAAQREVAALTARSLTDAKTREEAAEEVALLEATEGVLGTRGVRATVTASALSGLEAVANHWLGRVAGDRITVTLGASTALKGGGTTDTIDLVVHGAGGGNGYRGASAGERRRIDVAMLFALAETASAAAGRDPGTLWVDEAFDSLDTDGVAAVCAALAEVAAERCVVVITHNHDLADSLSPVQHIRVG